MADPVLVFIDDAMALHDPGPGHPERPARLQAIKRTLDAIQTASEGTITQRKPNPASRSQIERVHDPQYVQSIESLRGQAARLDTDTAVSPASVEAAYLAAGAAIDAVDAICNSTSQIRRAFAVVRPPGHHAERDRAMGFCVFNNIAVAAAHAIDQLGCQRVLIVDWDVHHGNGTQHIFERRRDVLYFSSHQWPLYPGTGALDELGEGDGIGFTVNAPLPARTADATVIELYRRLLVPIANEYRPDLVLVSAGFDAHRDDPLASLRMTEAGFAALCSIVRDIAGQHAAGRLALILEGGYNLDALTGGFRACMGILAGGPAPARSAEVDGVSEDVITQICDVHRRFWPV